MRLRPRVWVRALKGDMSTGQGGDGTSGKRRATSRASGDASAGGRRKVVDTQIGQMLRGAYQETVEEAIPDDLLNLLDRLK
jgi:hypothetical protein